MKNYIDQIERTVKINSFPQRIISLVPSITELLVDLGLEDRLVGCTKFCVHPVTIRETKTLIGGTKNIDLEIINTLKPDLIIASKEENVKEQIEALQFPTWVSDVSTLNDAISLITSLGEITNTAVNATKIISEINFFKNNLLPKKRVVYLIWRKPYMTVGGDTFINEMLTKAGFDNVFAQEKRYPIVTIEDIEKQKPDYIFLSTEPFPFKEKHFEEFSAICPTFLVDGEMFSWFGSRLTKSGHYFKELQDLLSQ